MLYCLKNNEPFQFNKHFNLSIKPGVLGLIVPRLDLCYSIEWGQSGQGTIEPITPVQTHRLDADAETICIILWSRWIIHSNRTCVQIMKGLTLSFHIMCYRTFPPFAPHVCPFIPYFLSLHTPHLSYCIAPLSLHVAKGSSTSTTVICHMECWFNPLQNKPL